MTPKGSLLYRLVPLPHRARESWWAVGVQVAPEAHGACGQVFGMGGGTALRALVGGSNVVCMRVWAFPCLPLSWRESMALNLVGGRAHSKSHFNTNEL